MKSYLFLGILCCSILFLQCKEVKEHTTNPAEQLLEHAVKGSGGWDSWKNLDTISFYKTTKLYLEDGSIQDSTYQLHTYFMYPEMNGKYSWKEGPDVYEVEYKNGKVTKRQNQELLSLTEEEQEKLRKGFLGAQFVMSLPFKLNDPGVKLALDGKCQINGKEVSVIKASYNTENNNHTESHDWWHYINPKTGALEGYKVHHAPTFARVSNVTVTQVKGISFPTYRKTYRVDKDDNPEYVRGEFWYEYLD